MGLGDLRQKVTEICWRLLAAGTIEGVNEWNHFSKLYCGVTDGQNREIREPQWQCSAEIQGVAALLTPMQQRDDNPTRTQDHANHAVSPRDVVTGVLGTNSNASISNVLVLGSHGSTPLKRMEIHLEDPSETPAILDLLAVALQEHGIEFRWVCNPAIPVTDIWLTAPLRDGRRSLLSSAATVSQETLSRLRQKPTQFHNGHKNGAGQSHVIVAANASVEIDAKSRRDHAPNHVREKRDETS